MSKEEITNAINEVLGKEYGFEIYVGMKYGDQRMKRFILEEGKPHEKNGFKKRIKNEIAGVIVEKYLSEGSQYADLDEIANEQKRFLIIPQSVEYCPFEFLNTPEEEMENFKLTDKNEAEAIWFKFTIQRDGKIKILWAYQKILPASIPNKKEKNFQLIVKSKEQPDVFREMPEQMFVITQKIDLLVVENNIVTDEITLMERHFGLEELIRKSAKEAAREITAVGLAANHEKLYEYVKRPNKKYAKKMMQIHKYPVASMSKEKLLRKIRTVNRWKNVFEIKNGLIQLRNYTDVENMIDLFTERYTKSEVTGQEYDTTVKDKAKPVE